MNEYVAIEFISDTVAFKNIHIRTNISFSLNNFVPQVYVYSYVIEATISVFRKTLVFIAKPAYN